MNSLNQVIYIKYKEKESSAWIKTEEKIAEITTIKERSIDITEGVGEEHIYESPKRVASRAL